uniref:CPSF_A domain-containing protein n=1 Tax=Mesocestoides corti TaxID=53468 RepID=A0A5K3EWR8_MESCO
MPSKLLDFSLYKEIAFFPSFGQSTIYNLCDLPSQCSVTNGEDPSCRKHDLMAASLLPAVESSSSNRCCTHYSFSSDGEKLTMTTADIVCLDAFYDDHAKHYVVCVGLVKVGDCIHANPIR